ncbi:hypothetical protein F4779DRAFT_619131 [Xylariaceae sp. FL0662B]|nr:hypothetical protein F4779DRAFT_619131 [Xylariaceae sp. FL0662B]
MRSSVLPAAVLVAAASVGAQTTTSTTTAADASSSCAAQNILDTCLASTTSYIALCNSGDYSCLCDKYIAIMTCFNNCPNDTRKPTYEQTKDLYCLDASIYGSTTTGTATTTSSATDSKTKDQATTTGDNDASGTRTSATSSVTASVNEAEILGNAPGMLAAFAGFAAAML